MKPTTTNKIAEFMMRTLALTFGGVALLGWIQDTFFNATSMSMDEADTSALSQLLRDGTIALPAVALVVFLGMRRAAAGRGSTLGTAALYSVVMGSGSLLRQLFPDGMHMGQQAETIATLPSLYNVLVVMVIAALFAAIAGPLMDLLSAPLAQLLDRLPQTRESQIGRVALPLAAIVVLAPALFLSGANHAAAQTSFPDQVIHPKGNLNLVAQTMPDGSLAYVAPDYGPLGIRPVIEMTEGETLNITLKNQLTADVSLHVHGVMYSDGTRHSNSFVRPGQQRVYQWRAGAGTAGYWHYHDHVYGDDEGTGGILGGLYGGLVVRKAGDPKPVKTFVLVGNDKTINGRIYPDTPTLTAHQGELVEFLVISHGNRVHTFHLHGHRWLTPSRGADPNPSLAANAGSGREDNHILAPGDSFGFMVIAGDGVGPGMWMYHCHFQDHASSMKGFFNVLPPVGGQANGGTVAQQVPAETSRTFKETGKTVSGRFLEYWDTHGGLAQQGLPLSGEIQEKSELDGKTYTVQYFERAVFEKHPENQPPYDVLLSQLGTFRYKQKYGTK